MDTEIQTGNHVNSQFAGAGTPDRDTEGKGIFEFVVAPFLRLHAYRNGRDRILGEALARRYCHTRSAK